MDAMELAYNSFIIDHENPAADSESDIGSCFLASIGESLNGWAENRLLVAFYAGNDWQLKKCPARIRTPR